MRLRAALRPAGGRPRRGTAALALACLLRALAGCGDEQSASVVTLDLQESIRNLAADDLDVSSAAEERLAAIGAPALPALHAALRREPEAVRLGIVQVLGEIRDDGAVAVLAAALGDPAEQVRADAAAALGQRSGAEAERAVIGAFGDGSELVRQRAALACVAACRSPAALDAVLRLALDDPAPEAGWAAVRSLVVLRGFDDP
ncbi:MAG TPA: HEAT repeat domain-containing protein, partial [Candidatus Limnocylindria bacterium]|nr:HEAT repeat domain-containing protein [Candidatus Limnocylindria bacterium]